VEGPQRRGDQEDLSSIGGYTNASTSLNYTQYFITTKSEMSETAIDLISDYLQNCQFDARRSHAGAGRRAAGAAAQPRQRRAFPRPALLGDDVQGAPDARAGHRLPRLHPTVDARRHDGVLQPHYMPQNCVVSIVGDVDKHEMLELVEALLRHLEAQAREPY
jgi:hypothetical protein